ncbi:SMP-30/gluconolactonase/LRE family protein [Micromonospora sp. MH33]|uniref:SMP-30/gluconolactonase/LRE family protein n=1 Tax=Micromonospora sp. MH33 TaxID=1945509 RepID=UPI0011B26604|nr:SMP-30/gluconolactonase/LRE family protein [Micromonospora sp. MH33]
MQRDRRTNMTGSQSAETDVLQQGFTFLEGPRWHDGEIWVSDMDGLAVHAVDVAGNVRTVTEVPGRPSGLGWLPDGRLLVVSMADRAILRLDPDGLTVHADLSALAAHDLNDMWVDRDGRAYISEMGVDIESFLAANSQAVTKGDMGALATADVPTAKLFRVDPDGSVAEVAADLRFPNGVTVSPDGEQLVVAETLGQRLSVYDLRDGRLAGRRTASLGFLPDGISAMDEEGCVWVASPFTNSAERVTLDGQSAGRVRSDRMVIACDLGGPDGRTLALCTAPGADRTATVRESRLETAVVSIPRRVVP